MILDLPECVYGAIFGYFFDMYMLIAFDMSCCHHDERLKWLNFLKSGKFKLKADIQGRIGSKLALNWTFRRCVPAEHIDLSFLSDCDTKLLCFWESYVAKSASAIKSVTINTPSSEKMAVDLRDRRDFGSVVDLLHHGQNIERIQFEGEQVHGDLLNCVLPSHSKLQSVQLSAIVPRNTDTFAKWGRKLGTLTVHEEWTDSDLISVADHCPSITDLIFTAAHSPNVNYSTIGLGSLLSASKGVTSLEIRNLSSSFYMWNAVAQFVAPTLTKLTVMGFGDLIVPPHALLTIARRSPDLQELVLKNCGHIDNSVYLQVFKACPKLKKVALMAAHSLDVVLQQLPELLPDLKDFSVHQGPAMLPQTFKSMSWHWHGLEFLEFTSVIKERDIVSLLVMCRETLKVFRALVETADVIMTVLSQARASPLHTFALHFSTFSAACFEQLLASCPRLEVVEFNSCPFSVSSDQFTSAICEHGKNLKRIAIRRTDFADCNLKRILKSCPYIAHPADNVTSLCGSEDRSGCEEGYKHYASLRLDHTSGPLRSALVEAGIM